MSRGFCVGDATQQCSGSGPIRGLGREQQTGAFELQALLEQWAAAVGVIGTQSRQAPHGPKYACLASFLNIWMCKNLRLVSVAFKMAGLSLKRKQPRGQHRSQGLCQKVVVTSGAPETQVVDVVGMRSADCGHSYFKP